METSIPTVFTTFFDFFWVLQRRGERERERYIYINLYAYIYIYTSLNRPTMDPAPGAPNEVWQFAPDLFDQLGVAAETHRHGSGRWQMGPWGGLLVIAKVGDLVRISWEYHGISIVNLYIYIYTVNS